ncbi:MAG: outer membrane protein assembly factor BamA [bacterium]
MNIRRLGVMLTCVLLFAATGVRAETVQEVRFAVDGPGALDTAYLIAHTVIRAGQTFDRGALEQDVRTLLKADRVSTVQADVSDAGNDAVILTYRIRPKLKLIEDVLVKGNDYYNISHIQDLMGLKAGDFVNDPAVAAAVSKVKQEYRKKRFVFIRVSWKLAIVNDREGTARLIVTLDEGSRTTIHSFNFTGNEHVSRLDLKEAVGLESWYNPIGWFTRKPYDQDELEANLDRIVQVYQKMGYLDVRVAQPVVKEGGDGRYDVTFPITEGRLFRVRSMTVAGATIYSTNVLRYVIMLRPGEVAAVDALHNAANALRDYYEERGYMRTRVSFENAMDDAAGLVDVCFTVHEGQLTTIRDVVIRGNAITRDKVIRRELTVYPGETFNGVQMRRSENRLKNLGFFSTVETYEESTAVSNRSDLVYEVEEQRTGQFMVGAGFSSIDQIIGYAEISQGNFDIRGWPFVGNGQKAKVRVEVGSNRRDLIVSFVEPWFLDRKLSLGVDLYYQQRQYDNYNQNRIGSALSLGMSLGGPHRLDWVYRIERVDTSDIADTNGYVYVDNSGKTNLFNFVESPRTESSLAATWSRDTRNSVFLPSRGTRLYATSMLMGGPMGGDTELYQMDVGVAAHVSPWWGHILNGRVRAQVVDGLTGSDQVPVSERLFAGGFRTIRGFQYRWVGPKGVAVDNGDVRPIGGQTLAIATVEYTIPIISKLRFATFVDAGNVWFDPYETDFSRIAVGAGFGIRLNIPGFPIRLDYTWPLQLDDPNTRTERFSFAVGYGF